MCIKILGYVRFPQRLLCLTSDCSVKYSYGEKQFQKMLLTMTLNGKFLPLLWHNLGSSPSSSFAFLIVISIFILYSKHPSVNRKTKKQIQTQSRWSYLQAMLLCPYRFTQNQQTFQPPRYCLLTCLHYFIHSLKASFNKNLK